jgi:hypothetical protein
MNFVLRSTQLQIECGCSREYQFRTGPSQAMMKDLARATSSPPAEFTADSYLMRNCLEFPKPLYFGRDTGLNFEGHGAVCRPIDSGDSGSTNCEIPLPAKIFSFGVHLYGPESWCGESCHSELFSCSCISLISLCMASICSFA